ncbi:DinB family protein [Chryseolinea sp. T2]|uniref:DinB family protein n=1 Tax=Chryseolinea sp. T2 TaxID=3129255 RepID=UPI0030770319
MNRKAIILHLWDTSYDVEGWHPPLKDALENMHAEGALWRPHQDAHNVWELLNHLICYKDRFVSRLEGIVFEPAITDNEQTFQRGIGTTESEWQARLSHLAYIQAVIREKVLTFSDADLDKPLPEAPIGGQLLSLASHDSYHTGQIMFLRKLQGLWPQKRDV